MKKQLLKALSISLLIPFLLSSCEMANTRDGWNGLADGAKLPAEFAIASGQPIIMVECLAGLRAQLNEGGLSDLERGEIALDMIDLLAVLSNVILKLVSYLLEEADPATLDISDFFDPAGKAFLEKIAQEQLMEAGIYADPAPMQLLWSILSLALYMGLDYDNLSPDQVAFYDEMVAEASALAAEESNTSFEPLLYQFRLKLGEPGL